MKQRNAIGIDPDSRGFVCAYVKYSDTKVAHKGYLATEADLKSFLRWVKGEKDVVVAVEGSNGLSKPIETALRDAGIVFYSFKPSDTERFRKAVLGQNKNNEKDAESVARYAMALEAQGKLENYRRVWFADMELQLLTRRYGSLAKQLTAEGNRLWKLLRYACPDLYLALAGKNPEVDCGPKMVKSQGILHLLITMPDVGQWKSLSEEQMLEAMGGGNYKGRRELVRELRKVVDSFRPISDSMALLLSRGAHQIRRLKEEQLHIVRMLEKVTAGNAAVQALRQMRGIGPITAATMIAEIIDIRRFAREDSLACYCGFGMREYSTGQTTSMRATELFNHRLKDSFMKAARNVVFYNPDSHLAGYQRNLMKAGMSQVQAMKRVARALVRGLYRKLSALPVAAETEAQTEDEKERGEGAMASGATRSGQGHVSDIALPSPPKYKAKTIRRVKMKVSRPKQTAQGRDDCP